MSCPDCEGVGGHDCERYGEQAPQKVLDLIAALEDAVNRAKADRRQPYVSRLHDPSVEGWAGDSLLNRARRAARSAEGAET